MEKLKSAQFGTEEVKDVLTRLGIENPTQETIRKLSFGEKSDLLANIKVQGVVKDGKIQLVKDQKGELHVQTFFKEQKLELPKKVLGYELNEKELKDLEKMERVKIPGKDVYLQVDKDLNKVTVSTGKEIGVPKEVGNYKLSDDDKALLSNGKELSPKVFQSPSGDYFLANLSVSSEKSSLTFSNIKQVSQIEAQELIQKLNNKDVVNTVAETAISAKSEKTIERHTEITMSSNDVKTEKVSIGENLAEKEALLRDKIIDAALKKDGEQLKGLTKEANALGDKIYNEIANSPNLKFEDKITVLAVAGKEPKNFLNEIKDSTKVNTLEKATKSITPDHSKV